MQKISYDVMLMGACDLFEKTNLIIEENKSTNFVNKMKNNPN